MPALVALALLPIAACRDPQSNRASLLTYQDTITVFAINGSPSVFANAIATQNRAGSQAVRVDDPVSFDLGLEIASDSSVIFIPARLLASSLAAPPRVGLLVDTVRVFDSITVAPTRGFVYDTATVRARPGDVVIVESSAAVCGQNSTGNTAFSKIVVDSIRLIAPPRAFLRILTNPNCGFRSLRPGLPSR